MDKFCSLSNIVKTKQVSRLDVFDWWQCKCPTISVITYIQKYLKLNLMCTNKRKEMTRVSGYL